MMTVGRILRTYSPIASQVAHHVGAYLWFHEAIWSNSPSQLDRTPVHDRVTPSRPLQHFVFRCLWIHLGGVSE